MVETDWTTGSRPGSRGYKGSVCRLAFCGVSLEWIKFVTLWEMVPGDRGATMSVERERLAAAFGKDQGGPLGSFGVTSRTVC